MTDQLTTDYYMSDGEVSSEIDSSDDEMVGEGIVPDSYSDYRFLRPVALSLGIQMSVLEPIVRRIMAGSRMIFNYRSKVCSKLIHALVAQKICDKYPGSVNLELEDPNIVAEILENHNLQTPPDLYLNVGDYCIFVEIGLSTSPEIMFETKSVQHDILKVDTLIISKDRNKPSIGTERINNLIRGSISDLEFYTRMIVEAFAEAGLETVPIDPPLAQAAYDDIDQMLNDMPRHRMTEREAAAHIDAISEKMPMMQDIDFTQFNLEPLTQDPTKSEAYKGFFPVLSQSFPGRITNIGNEVIIGKDYIAKLNDPSVQERVVKFIKTVFSEKDLSKTIERECAGFPEIVGSNRKKRGPRVKSDKPIDYHQLKAGERRDVNDIWYLRDFEESFVEPCHGAPRDRIEVLDDQTDMPNNVHNQLTYLYNHRACMLSKSISDCTRRICVQAGLKRNVQSNKNMVRIMPVYHFTEGKPTWFYLCNNVLNLKPGPGSKNSAVLLIIYAKTIPRAHSNYNWVKCDQGYIGYRATMTDVELFKVTTIDTIPATVIAWSLKCPGASLTSLAMLFLIMALHGGYVAENIQATNGLFRQFSEWKREGTSPMLIDQKEFQTKFMKNYKKCCFSYWLLDISFRFHSS